MSTGVLAIVLLAALLHALWNALVKGAVDRTVMLGLIALGHVIPGIALALSLPAPDPASWIFIVASTLIHWAYYYLLNRAYQGSDLSVIYPIVRGSAPIMIALVAWLVLDEAITAIAWTGILLITLSIFLLARPRQIVRMEAAGLWAAFGTATMIAAYSIADGVGVRLSGEPLSYVAWLFTAEIFVAAFILGTRHRRLLALPRKTIVIGIIGGVVSGLAYALALWAKTQAPLGLVSAMRETSVLFAALIGVFWFGEGPRMQRLIAASIVCAGVIMIAIA